MEAAEGVGALFLVWVRLSADGAAGAGCPDGLEPVVEVAEGVGGVRVVSAFELSLGAQ